MPASCHSQHISVHVCCTIIIHPVLHISEAHLNFNDLLTGLWSRFWVQICFTDVDVAAHVSCVCSRGRQPLASSNLCRRLGAALRL